MYAQLNANKVILKWASANREAHAKWGHLLHNVPHQQVPHQALDSNYFELKGRRVYKGWQQVDRIPQRCYVNGYYCDSSDLGAHDAGQRLRWCKHIFNCCQVTQHVTVKLVKREGGRFHSQTHKTGSILDDSAEIQ